MTVQGFMPIYNHDKRPRIWFPTLCMCCLVYVSLLRQRENWGGHWAPIKAIHRQWPCLSLISLYKKTLRKICPGQTWTLKFWGGYSVICLAIHSPMYWECRNRYPRADLHTVLVSTMSQITAILFCLCDWQLSGLHPLTKEKRARQYGVSSESWRHRQAWLKQRFTPYPSQLI